MTEEPHKPRKTDWSGELKGSYDPILAQTAAVNHAQTEVTAAGWGFTGAIPSGYSTRRRAPPVNRTGQTE